MEMALSGKLNTTDLDLEDVEHTCILTELSVCCSTSESNDISVDGDLLMARKMG